MDGGMMEPFHIMLVAGITMLATGGCAFTGCCRVAGKDDLATALLFLSCIILFSVGAVTIILAGDYVCWAYLQVDGSTFTVDTIYEYPCEDVYITEYVVEAKPP